MNPLYDLLNRILDVDKSKITDSMSPNEVDTWDSFNALVLVSELESTFKVKFNLEEVNAVKNVGDIKAALRKHGVEIQ
jgi:acyl carrier protein